MRQIRNMSILFDEIVFGPVHSRRFGTSLGMNLLPLDYKFCTFNCVYCECGWTYPENMRGVELPSFADIKQAMQERFPSLSHIPDNITFAGNGEPTIHPEFSAIIDETIRQRDKHLPGSKITVLSNASQLHKPKIFDALKKVDNNVLKLDAGTESMFQAINNPAGNLTLETVISHLKLFDKSELTIQTLFLRGQVDGEKVDNTTDEEIHQWLEHLKEINPGRVMIYSIDREPPAKNLERIGRKELEQIAHKVRDAGIATEIY